MSVYNQITGSVLNSYKRQLFREFDKENCYLAFARKDETWGGCALVNISIPQTENINSILASKNVNEEWETAGRFVDKSVSIYNSDPSLSYVKIYKTESSVDDFDTNLSMYYAINNPAIAEITLELLYINSNWCVIKGLPTNFSEYINNKDGSKYYIVTGQPSNTYPEHPISGSKIVKINTRDLYNNFSLNENVKLILSSPPDNEHVTRWDTTKLMGIVKSTSNLGETYVSGLVNSAFFNITPEFDTEDKIVNYINRDLGYLSYTNISMNDAGYYFYLVNSNNVKVSDNLYLQPNLVLNSVFNYDESASKYMVFKSKKSNSGADTDNTLKITSDVPISGLAIYHESLPFTLVSTSTSVSDANPPALDISYLKQQTFDNSIFDIGGYVNIKKDFNNLNGSDLVLSSKVSYCKELRTTTEKNKFLALGFTTETKKIESVSLNSSSVIYRTGNIRPKPNGLPYLPTDKRLYVWTNNFIINDRVKFRISPDPEEPVYIPTDGSYLTITSIDYDEGYIGFSTEIGSSEVESSVDDTNSSPQIISEGTNILAFAEYAICDNINDALTYGMDSVMIDLQIPASLPNSTLYDDMYRQVAICHKPQYTDSQGLLVDCSDIFVKNGTGVSLFNEASHEWTPGTILYLSNKHPIHRKYISNREVFKLII